MKRSEVNKDPERARKRAKNDARTALLRLAEWADELGEHRAAAGLRDSQALVAAAAALLQSKQDLKNRSDERVAS